MLTFLTTYTPFKHSLKPWEIALRNVKFCAKALESYESCEGVWKRDSQIVLCHIWEIPIRTMRCQHLSVRSYDFFASHICVYSSITD